MTCVILAGGLGTRISEESHLKPKPMIEIGGKPILWHIMKTYSMHGINDFIICLGYKGYVIKEYFANYSLHTSDISFDMQKNEMTIHHKRTEPWVVTLIDTGEDSATGGRLKHIKNFLNPQEPFCMTYGDGVSDIDITAEIKYHNEHGKLATICAVQPPGRFGSLIVEDSTVKGFQEKPAGDGAWINGGFFILNTKVIDYIDNAYTVWENEPLQNLAKDGELKTFFHKDFWQPMDTIRDKNQLEDLWKNGKAPWKTWQ